uniref:Ammonium transporter n=1 Tax=Macrostomum lignano TaxID=282301 RepID=A0A1I8HP43_9PLAT
ISAIDIDSLSADMTALKESLNDVFLCLMSIVILSMQVGFALLEAGSVPAKNVTSILLRNVLDSFVGATMYYLFGYALSFGQPDNRFCGAGYWALSGLPTNRYSHFLFNAMFAATAASIVSGAVADRSTFSAYTMYTALISGFVYPIVSHWVWSPRGWLAATNVTIVGVDAPVQLRFMDFAGSGVVHLLGGSASFVAAVILRPRIGRFPANSPTSEPTSTAATTSGVIPGHSVPLVATGGFVLFCGFLAFNGGSHASVSSVGDGRVLALAMLNTLLSGSASGLTVLAVSKIRTGRWSLLSTVNAGLSGMVSICASCNSVEPWAALATGVVAGVAYLACSNLVVRLRVDDPVEAVSVHFSGGLVGLLLVALFHSKRGILANPGLLSALNFAWQLVGLIVIIAWSTGFSLAVFGCLQLAGWYRVSELDEGVGLDKAEHGEAAYPYERLRETGELLAAKFDDCNEF